MRYYFLLDGWVDGYNQLDKYCIRGIRVDVKSSSATFIHLDDLGTRWYPYSIPRGVCKRLVVKRVL